MSFPSRLLGSLGFVTCPPYPISHIPFVSAQQVMERRLAAKTSMPRYGKRILPAPVPPAVAVPVPSPPTEERGAELIAANLRIERLQLALVAERDAQFRHESRWGEILRPERARKPLPARPVAAPSSPPRRRPVPSRRVFGRLCRSPSLAAGAASQFESLAAESRPSFQSTVAALCRGRC